ncbi:hypothetical protein AVEN_93222-1, partial [Araneus ventricosus]
MGSLKPTDTDTISEYARFLILTVPNGELGNMSPFAVEKALKRFGHSKTACRGKQTCSKCASVDHNTPDCNSPELLCVNCKQPHSSDSRDCPQWKLEKKIQELRAR